MPKLSRFFAASSDLLMVTKAQGGEAYRINPAFSRTLGWQEPELDATTFLDLVHPDDALSAQAAFSKLGRGDQAVETAFRMRAKAGGWRCIEWHATAFPEEGLHYWLGRDITDRSRINGTGAAAETSALRESMGDAYFAVDANWNITAVNRRATDLAQVTRGEVIGAYLWDVLWEMKATNSPGYRYFNQAMVERRQIDFEQYNPTHDFWASVSVYPQHDGGLWVFVRDVSARRQAEDGLRAREALLSAILEHLPIGVGLIDKEGRVLNANSPFRRLVPEIVPSLDEARGHRWRAYRPDGEPIERSEYPAMRALRGETVVPGIDFLHEGDDARQSWIRLGAVPFHDPSWPAAGAVVYATDITAQKQIEAALRASEERLRLAQELGGVGSFDWDLDDDTAEVSDQLRQIFGLPPERPTSSEHFFSEVVHPDDAAPLRDAVTAALEAGDVFKSEFRIIRLTDGELRWVQVQAGVVRDRKCGRTRFMGIVRDVTERRQAQERLELLMREVDHRGKNLLAVMRSVVQRTQAASAGELIAAMTGRIEALARVHTLLADSSWVGVRLEALVHDELAPFGTTSVRAQYRGPSVKLQPAAAQMMGLVLHELATNAAKHGALSTPEGRVAVEWSVDRKTGELTLYWTERGGPEVEPPDSRGFGTSIIQSGLAYQLGATVQMDWQSHGLVVHFTLPAEYIESVGRARAEPPREPASAMPQS